LFSVGARQRRFWLSAVGGSRIIGGRRQGGSDEDGLAPGRGFPPGSRSAWRPRTCVLSADQPL